MGLCWGFFLNSLAHRLISGVPLFSTLSCQVCHPRFAWYYSMPVFSWFASRDTCAHGADDMMPTSPFIECVTALSFVGIVFFVDPRYCIAYILFFSALIVTIRTDLDYFLILRCMTLGIAPIGMVAGFLGYLPISGLESIVGAVTGAGILWLVRAVFWQLRHQEGLGLGDIDLMAAIGSFLGPVGVLGSLFLGSLLGSFYGLAMLLANQNKDMHQIRIPFGAFLAFSAIVIVLAGAVPIFDCLCR